MANQLKVLTDAQAAEKLGYAGVRRLPVHVMRALKAEGIVPCGVYGRSNKSPLWDQEKIEEFSKIHPFIPKMPGNNEMRSSIHRSTVQPIVEENNAMLKALCKEWKLKVDGVMGLDADEKEA